MIDGSDRALSPHELEAVEQHVTRCPSCSRFQEDLQNIRNGLKSFSCPSPSEELLRRTRSLCHSEWESMRVSGAGVLPGNRSRSVPKIIWASVFALVVLTGILIISLLPGFEIGKPLSLKTALVLTLIVQNAAMLFFAPVLLQKLRFHNNHFDSNGYDNLVP
jgi:hypothetical protein